MDWAGESDGGGYAGPAVNLSTANTSRPRWKIAPTEGPGEASRFVDEAGSTVGTLISFNAIEDAEAQTLEVPGVVLIRSGWPAPNEPPAWMPMQRTRAMMGLEALERVSHGRTLCLWPRATDAVSDIPGILAFMRAHAAWKFLLDPAALLTPEMEKRAEDHAERMLEALAGHPALVGLVVPPPGHVVQSSFAKAGDWFGPRVALVEMG